MRDRRRETELPRESEQARVVYHERVNERE